MTRLQIYFSEGELDIYDFIEDQKSLRNMTKSSYIKYLVRQDMIKQAVSDQLDTPIRDTPTPKKPTPSKTPLESEGVVF